MIPDTLYDLALAFKKTKLWMKLYDSQLFAVRHSDGSIGYCCVMGMMGEHLALAEYPGDSGMDAYRKMGVDRSKMDIFDRHEIDMAQDCLMVSFQNKSELRKREVTEVNAYTTSHGITLRGRKAYPQFERFRPHHFPWRLDDETDQKHLAESLEAALEVSNRLILTAPETLGFTEGAPFEREIPLLEKENGVFVWKTIDLGIARDETYVSPKIIDDITLAKLAKCKKRRGEWACDIYMHLEAMSDEAEDGRDVEDPISAPYFPFVLLITETESGMVLGAQICKELDDASEFIRCLVDLALKAGKPTRILVPNERAHAFFTHLAPALGAKLVKRKNLPSLIEAKQDFAERFGGLDEGGNEDIESMMAMLSDPDAYDDMPDEVLLILLQAAESCALPEGVLALVKRECKKRGI